MPSKDYNTYADLPPNTCPLIDAAISEICDSSPEDLDLNNFRTLMERIRDANSNLRSEAERLEEVATKMGEELDSLADTVDELREQVNQLQIQLDAAD